MDLILFAILCFVIAINRFFFFFFFNRFQSSVRVVFNGEIVNGLNVRLAQNTVTLGRKTTRERSIFVHIQSISPSPDLCSWGLVTLTQYSNGGVRSKCLTCARSKCRHIKLITDSPSVSLSLKSFLLDPALKAYEPSPTFTPPISRGRIPLEHTKSKKKQFKVESLSKSDLIVTQPTIPLLLRMNVNVCHSPILSFHAGAILASMT